MNKRNIEHKRTLYSINNFSKINQQNKFVANRASLNASMTRKTKPPISLRQFGNEIHLTNNLTVYNNDQNIKTKKQLDLKHINAQNKNKKNKNIERNYTEINYINKENNRNSMNIKKFGKEHFKKIIKNDNKNYAKENNSSTINNDDSDDDSEIKKEEKDILNKLNQIQIYNENPQLTEEYFDDIYNDFIAKEENYLPEKDYMLKQNDINHRMRAILIDWLIDVHNKYKLVPQTMYISVNLIDRYLSKNDTSRPKLQLVGVTSMFIASKYEDIYPPKLKDLVYVTDHAYVKDDVLIMENKMLKSLNFDITFPTQWSFLELYKKKLNLDNKTFFLAWFLMELGLINYKMIKYKMSQIASSAIFISCKTLNKYNKQNFEKATDYNESTIKECVKEIYEYYVFNSTHKLKAIRKKFSSTKFEEVAKIEIKSDYFS